MQAVQTIAEAEKSSPAECAEPCASSTPKQNLLGEDRAGLQAFFKAAGEPSFRATQLIRWVHQRGITKPQDMTDFAKPLREKLAERATFQAPEIDSTHIATDGTVKWLFRLADGNRIETVFIPDVGRGSLCVSSQVGCYLDCTFCRTGAEGFNRNLTSAEIIGQVWQATKALETITEQPEWRALAPTYQRQQITISNVIFMGMGEPLLNMKPVMRATRLLLDDVAYGLSKRRVTISTAGIVPMMLDMAHETDASLAVSLHAATDDLRDELVPLNRKYPIADLMAACKTFVKASDSKRHILFEYVMLAGVNDSAPNAKALARLLADMPCKVNLIPFNPYPGTAYTPSPKAQILAFQHILHTAGIRTTIRRTRGENIAAACGQLAGDFLNRRRTITFKPARNMRKATTPAATYAPA